MMLFCRLVVEEEAVLDGLTKHGPTWRERIQFLAICEVLNNIRQVDQRAKVFDGFATGSGQLMPRTPGIDRDTTIVTLDLTTAI